MKRIVGWYSGLIFLIIFTSNNVLNSLQSAERSGYYSVVTKSMSRSWHNFWFGASDPGALISLDKIPGSYWIPALAVKYMGFHNRTVVGPNAIATILAVVVIAYAGKRLGGNAVGLFSGILLATTPIITSVARSNQPLSFFLLDMSLAALLLVQAFCTEKRGWLIGAGVAIAIAFQSYMIVAWALWPAVALAWVFTKRNRMKKLLDLAIAGFISAGLSVTWIFVVWLTPAKDRPYIGNTFHNNPWEMVFGYNGLGRFSTGASMTGAEKTMLATYRTFTPPFSGNASIFRFFYHQIAGQISWLIPATIISLLWLILRHKTKPVNVLLLAWFATFLIMYSAVAGMHQFYTAILAIPMSLIVASSLFEMIRARAYLWLITLTVSTASMAIYITNVNEGYLSQLLLLETIAGAVITIGLAILRFAHRKPEVGGQINVWVGALVTISLALMLLSPVAWTIDAPNHPSFINPMAGPMDDYTARLAENSKKNAPQSHNDSKGISHKKIINYLKLNRHGSKFLVAAFGVDAAAPFILQSSERVVAIGGFSGADPVPTLKGFIHMVRTNEVNFVLANHFTGDKKPYHSWESAKIKRWVKSNCTKLSLPVRPSSMYRCR